MQITQNKGAAQGKIEMISQLIAAAGTAKASQVRRRKVLIGFLHRATRMPRTDVRVATALYYLALGSVPQSLYET